MDTKKEKSNCIKSKRLNSKGQLKKKKKKKWKTKGYLDTKKEKANKTTSILIFLIFIYTTLLFFKNVFHHCSILLSKIKFTY